MNRKAVLDHITGYISKFRLEIESNNKLNLTDINIHAENFLIPLLRAVYGWNLINTNLYSMNSPAIDLEDRDSRIAVQVTATGTSAKIKKTLVKYKIHHGIDKHNLLIVLILTKKQRRYKSEDVIDHAKQIPFFSLENDIIDFDDLLKEIHGLHNLNTIKEIHELLQLELSDARIELRRKSLKGVKEESFVSYQTNLVDVTLPNSIYEYSIDIDRERIIRNSWKTDWKLSFKASTHLVFSRGVKFLSEKSFPPFYQYGDSLFTFESIQDYELYSLCSPGSEKIRDVEEFAIRDISFERIVIGLLNRTLISDLYYKYIAYKYSEKVFFFEKFGDENNRKISYLLEKSSSRDVVTPMFLDDEGKPKVYKHLAFKASFIRCHKSWFLAIRPTWLFTTNGYKVSFYNSDQISEQKRRENNQSVNNAFEFIRFCLNNEIDIDNNPTHPRTLKFQAIPPVTVKLEV